jgi:hypothetical protein
MCLNKIKVFSLNSSNGLCPFFASVESTKLVREQSAVLSNESGKDQVDALEVRRLKEEVGSLKKKILG